MKEIEPKSKFLDADGLRLHYLEWGSFGLQPMLLLHGFMSQAHVWDDFASNVKDNYLVLALDQRGHGKSQWTGETAYTIDDHFSDIHHFVKALDLSRLTLVGHSMGGRNALFFAACLPDKVSRLVLIDSRPGNSPQAAQALKDHIARLPLQVSSLNEVVLAIRDLYPSLSPEICLDMAQAGYITTPEGTFVPKYDVKMGDLVEESGFLVEEIWPFLKNVTCPTLVVRGAESPFLSPEDCEKMCGLMPRAQWKEIPEATHMPALENPFVFHRVVLDFLNKAEL